jgi:adenine-specific DNA-methyltransferase
MCLWDDPGVSTTRIHAEGEQFSRGMYRADRHQSLFCIKSQAPGAFERLFAAVRDLQVPLVLSYSPYASGSNARPRVMTVDQLLSIARKYFNRVETASAGRISHMKLNMTRLNADPTYDAELIFFCS